MIAIIGFKLIHFIGFIRGFLNLANIKKFLKGFMLIIAVLMIILTK